MPTDDNASSAEPAEQKCEKCDEATELLSFIRRFGDRPAYHIFECSACKHLTWIAQAISE
jgi:DNA-directed RNA polymerase subunit M/transcription elongation factor TFIIS